MSDAPECPLGCGTPWASDADRRVIRLEMLREVSERVMVMETRGGDWRDVSAEFDRMIAEEEAKS